VNDHAVDEHHFVGGDERLVYEDDDSRHKGPDELPRLALLLDAEDGLKSILHDEVRQLNDPCLELVHGEAGQKCAEKRSPAPFPDEETPANVERREKSWVRGLCG
jgi:hypothetical protein